MYFHLPIALPHQTAVRGVPSVQVLVSDEFLDALDASPPPLRQRVLNKVRLLVQDPAHPSLNAHRLQRIKAEGKWECYITDAHRLIYEPGRDTLMLWKLGDHRVVDRVHCASFAPHTQFRRWEPDQLEEGSPDEPPYTELAAAAQPETFAPGAAPAGPAGVANPFGLFSRSHLRILGVPAGLVKAVQRAPTAEGALSVPGLPAVTVGWLEELATNPDLEHVLFDPGRLTFRTTLDRLEGYCEGAIRRLMLNLSADQERLVRLRVRGLLLLKGCAGSGKTTVGIYRAIERAQQGRRVLMMTFNRTLNQVTRALIEELIGPLPANLEVINYDRWVFELLARRGVRVSPGDRRERVAQAMAEVAQQRDEQVLRRSPSFFEQEIARVIKGGGITTLQQYVQAQRYGRGTALAPAQRAAVWAVFEAYQRLLDAAGEHDFADLTRLAHAELRRDPLPAPYDDVIVDEAQDLSALQLKVTQQLAGSGSVIILADAAQTIYSRGFSWRDADLDVRGRTRVLRKNFRNTREIAMAAAHLAAHNTLLRASGEYIEPEWTQRRGPWPIMLQCDLRAREPRTVRDRILDLVAGQQFRPGDFAIVAPTNQLCVQYRDDLIAHQVPAVNHRDEDFDLLDGRVKVLTIHSAKGLEFPVVFVVGLHPGELPYRPPPRPGAEEEDLLEYERQRTLLYVAMTRAAEALYLVTTMGAESPLLAELGELVRVEPCRPA